MTAKTQFWLVFQRRNDKSFDLIFANTDLFVDMRIPLLYVYALSNSFWFLNLTFVRNDEFVFSFWLVSLWINELERQTWANAHDKMNELNAICMRFEKFQCICFNDSEVVSGWIRSCLDWVRIWFLNNVKMIHRLPKFC